MEFNFDTRPSDSPLVEAIWRSQTEQRGGSFISTAVSLWEMVITKEREKFTLSIRGPETKASPAPIPVGYVEYVGIIFKHGVFMPHIPKQELVDNALHLPESAKHSFRLQSGSWQFPDFENADTFVNKLVRENMLMHDQVVEDVLRGQTKELSLRSLQRRFLHVTGLTYKTIQQIERAPGIDAPAKWRADTRNRVSNGIFRSTASDSFIETFCRANTCADRQIEPDGISVVFLQDEIS